jgi:hypothetical protein
MDITLCPLQWSPLAAGGEVDLGEGEEAFPLVEGEEEVGGVEVEVVVEEVGVVLAEGAEEEGREAGEVVGEEAVAVVLAAEEEGETNLLGM